MTVGRIPVIEGGIQPTIFDAKADLLTATAADTPARLAVGSNDQVLTADSSTATGLKWAPSGKVLQVVYSDSFTLTTNSSTTYATTGISASITPSASTSKIFVMVKIPWQYLSGSSTVGFSTRLYRDGASITNLDIEAARNLGVSSGLNGSSTHLYLDSPASTSSETYEVFGALAGTSATVYWGGQGQKAQLVLMEIGA